MPFRQSLKDTWNDLTASETPEERELREAREKRRKKQVEVPCDLNQISSSIEDWFNDYDPHRPFWEYLLKKACEMQTKDRDRKLKLYGWPVGGDQNQMSFVIADILQGLWEYIDPPREYEKLRDRRHQLEWHCHQRRSARVEIKIEPPGGELASFEEPKIMRSIDPYDLSW